MARQLSTSVSDFVLACSVLYVSYSLYGIFQIYAAIGLAIQGTAASFGVVRYSLRRPEGTNILFMHKLMSWLAAAAGVALVAYQFCSNYGSTFMGHIVASFSGVVTATAQFQNANNKELFTQACSGLALLTTLVLSAMNFNMYGLAAALVYILAGAIVGSSGTLVGIQRIDILHYALAIGNVLFLFALS